MPKAIAGALLSGVVNKMFGGKASGAMQQGADEASKVQKYMYDTTRGDLAPYRTSGYAANNKLAQMMGLDTFDRAAIESSLRNANPNKYGASTTTTSGSTAAPTDWKSIRDPGQLTAEQRAIIAAYRPDLLNSRNAYDNTGGMTGPTQGLADAQFRARGINDFMKTYKPQGASSNSATNAALQADIDAEIARLKSDSSYGSLAKKFGMSDFEADPGYAFRLSEGQKALERSQAAKGGLMSGSAIKAALDYGQGMGSQEYGNAYGRFRDWQDSAYNKYAGISNQGMGAVNTGAQNNQNYANNMSGIYGNLANAKAASAINQGNQMNQSLGNIFGNSTYGGYGGNNFMAGLSNIGGNGGFSGMYNTGKDLDALFSSGTFR